jgi:hypothetical protein
MDSAILLVNSPQRLQTRGLTLIPVLLTLAAVYIDYRRGQQATFQRRQVNLLQSNDETVTLAAAVQ